LFELQVTVSGFGSLIEYNSVVETTIDWRWRRGNRDGVSVAGRKSGEVIAKWLRNEWHWRVGFWGLNDQKK
jgi:hypothetical protein